VAHEWIGRCVEWRGSGVGESDGGGGGVKWERVE
jgi:hypothetical protein